VSGSSVHPTAILERNVKIGDNSKIWHFTHVREGASIGDSSIIGSHVYIGAHVTIGKNCKIQNGAKIYEHSICEDGVFIGPNVVLTNDNVPRAINPNQTQKNLVDWIPVSVFIENGASIGAGSILIAPIRIGSWSMVGAGAVVTQDVPAFAKVIGVPARFHSWVGKSGFSLEKISKSTFVCPITDEKYHLVESNKLVAE